MMRSQCDYCQKLDNVPPPAGWVILAEIADTEEADGLAALFARGTAADTKGTFCGWLCASQYAAARALVGSVKPGEAP